MKEPKDTADAYAMYLVINEVLGMSPGKIAAQVGHAVMELCEKFYEAKEINDQYECSCGEDVKKYCNWIVWRSNCRKVVLKANTTQWRQLRPMADVLIIDSGYTEIAPNSETVLGFWPMKKSEAPREIQKLQVL